MRSRELMSFLLASLVSYSTFAQHDQTQTVGDTAFMAEKDTSPTPDLSIEPSTEPSDLSSWRDTTPSEHVSMIFTLETAPYDIHQLTPNDVVILNNAVQRLGSTTVRGRNLMEETCRQVLAGNFSNAKDAPFLAEKFAEAENFVKTDVIALFNDAVDALSPESKQLVIQYQTETLRRANSSNNINWIKYAILAPEAAVNNIKLIWDGLGRPQDY